MARKRFGVTFKGFEEMAERVQDLGGNVKYVVEKCLEAVPEIVNPMAKRDISIYDRHKKGGKSALDSLVENPRVEWDGMRGVIPVGFKIVPYGLPTIFFMYGTKPHTPRNQFGTFPRHEGKPNPYVKQNKALYNDFYGTSTSRKINEKQKEIFAREIDNLMKKK